jgi:multidrug efflux pump subunit AcrA (membrane-fusion protein)
MRLTKKDGKRSKLKLVLLAFGLLITVGLIGGGLSGSEPTFVTEKPRTMTISSSLSEKGTVVAVTKQDVVAPDGSVTEVLVVPGQTVRPGQELFRVKRDTTNIETVTSLIDGTVSSVNISVGSFVGANSSQTAPVVIADLNNLKIKLNVSENDVNKFTKNQTANVTFSAIKDKKFNAKVLSVDSVGTVDNALTTYQVYVKLDEINGLLKPGMSAKVSFETAKKDDALTVPTSALKTGAAGRYLEVVDKSNGTTKAKQVLVTTGIKDNQRTEILSGLDLNTEFITSSTASK